MSKMKIEIKDNTAYVYTPYNPGFVEDIKTIGKARWNSMDRCWTVPAAAVDRVREIMMDIYGETDLPDGGKRVAVRVKFLADVEREREPFVLFGKIIAAAHDRDSGARPGDDVVLLEGKLESGGSCRYWKTIVPEGTVVEVHDVPEAALWEGSWFEYEIVDKGIDREALEAEREKLLARLAEINSLLASAEEKGEKTKEDDEIRSA